MLHKHKNVLNDTAGRAILLNRFVLTYIFILRLRSEIKHVHVRRVRNTHTFISTL